MSGDYKNSFVFELIKPIPYHRGGTQEEATTITLKAPSQRQGAQTSKLKQGYCRAQVFLAKEVSGMNLPKQDEKPESEEDDVISPDTIITTLMSSNIDIEKYNQAFKDLLLGGVAWVIDDQLQLNAATYDQIGFKDAERMLGEYLSTFLL